MDAKMGGKKGPRGEDKEYSLVKVNELLQRRLHYLLYLLEDHQRVASKQTTAHQVRLFGHCDKTQASCDIGFLVIEE